LHVLHGLRGEGGGGEKKSESELDECFHGELGFGDQGVAQRTSTGMRARRRRRRRWARSGHQR
jgi:hypothetical protein